MPGYTAPRFTPTPQMPQAPTYSTTPETFGQAGNWNLSIGKPPGQGNDLLNPLGSASIRRALYQRALRNQRNTLHKGSVLAGLSGLDPMGQRQGLLDFGRQASGQLAGDIQGGELQQLMNQQQFLQGNYRQQQDFQNQIALLDRQRRIAEAQRGNPFGQFLGSLAGSALPR